MAEWLLAIVLWLVGLVGVHELPPAGGCVPAPGPAFVSASASEHRPMCVDSFGTMREQAGTR